MTLIKDWATTAGFTTFRKNDREEHDYYATEPKAAELLLKLDDFNDIWECACGGGHLAEVFKKEGKLAMATDKYDRGYSSSGELIDFLEYEGEWDGDIITNPPYKHASKFIERGISLLQDEHKLALFLPTRYLSSKSRRAIFEKYPPYKVWVASSRLNCAVNGEFERFKSSAMDYAWFVWHNGYDGETKLGWFN